MFNVKLKMMKKHILLLMLSFLSVSCSGQKDNEKIKDLKKEENQSIEVPKGDWKVEKEFDENGNLIRYDSIYSWSSGGKLDDLSLTERDSMMQSFKSKFFSNFSHFENDGFDAIFSEDSLFSKRFFNNDFFGSSFGKDFMNIDQMRQQMITRQRDFLEKYQSEFIKPKDENY